MYIGNGVTKRFPLPDGKNGDEVYLIFPTGRSIKMLKEEGYTVSEGTVYFSAAIPAGVVVSFDEPEQTEESGEPLSYVVIYKDGRITEVVEDPAEYLEQSQEILKSSQKHYEEVTNYAENTIQRVLELKEKMTNEFEGILYSYTQQGKNILDSTAALLTAKIHEELSNALQVINQEAQTIEAGLSIMEMLKQEAKTAAQESAEKFRAELTEKNQEIQSIYDKAKSLAEDYKYYMDESKDAARKAGLDLQAAMTLKVNEEIEMLKSLRLKLETDRETLNNRIDNALEVLRGEINGR